jgi:flap endonuclease-1
MHIYQFLIVVGRQGDQMLTNEAGEVTSHLQGMFYRTTRLLEAGACAGGGRRAGGARGMIGR